MILEGSGGGLTQEIFLDFYSLSPLSWVSEPFRQDIDQISTWKVFLLLRIYYY